MKKYLILIRSYWYYIAMFIVIIIYLFFPGNNLSIDSFEYGCNVKYGEDLFLPHHLFYSFFNYLLYDFVIRFIPSIDALKFMQFVNGIFALLSLILFHKIITKKTNDKEKANSWTFFIASCFGVMRFAVNVETYIIPIFFSLLSSYSYLNYLKTRRSRYILFCSIAASVACLFHQIHLFWGIGLFIGLLRTKKIKNILLFLIPTFTVLIAYSTVLTCYIHIPFSIENLITYLADYYYSNDADIHIGSVNFILTPISFFRTFFQVHGNIVNILQLVPAFYAIIPVAAVFLGISLYKMKSIRFKKPNFQYADFEFTHFIIFILQLAFAFFSHGNAEFMVMLPFLIPFFIYVFADFNNKFITYMAFAMLIWNFCFAIFPDNHFNYQNNEGLISTIEENPDKIFFLKEKSLIAGRLYYERGKKERYRLLDDSDTTAIKSFIKENKVFYTDVLTKKMPFSRGHIACPSDYSNIIFVRNIKHIHSDLGGFYVDEIKFKE